VEQYIDRCAAHLISQSIGIENLELIFVNDGSSDGTYNKLLEWEKKFPDSIAVISYDENLRAGGARNVGMQYATADWIGFFDADDFCELNMYEVLYSYAKTDKYDYVVSKLIRDSDGYRKILIYDNREDKEYFFEKADGYYFGEMKETGVNGILGGTVASLIRRSVIVDNDVFFPEKLAYEDNYWGDVLSLYISSCYIVDLALYYYWFNPESTILKRNQPYLLDRLTIEEMLLDKYKELGIVNTRHDYIEYNFLQRYYCNTWYMIFKRFDYIPEVLLRMNQKVLSTFPNYERNPYIETMTLFNQEILRMLKISVEPDEKTWRVLKETYLQILEIE